MSIELYTEKKNHLKFKQELNQWTEKTYTD